VTGVLHPPGVPLPLLFEPLVLLTVDGVLSDMLDLTDGAVHGALQTTHQELTGDWALQQADYLLGTAVMPPTQVLGQAACDVGGITGFKYRSSKNVAGPSSIVVFPNRLKPGQSELRVYNRPSGLLQHRLP
jgi:hypothetical protein